MKTTKKTIATPQLQDLLAEAQAETMRSTNCVKIGRIESFDGAKKTAQIQLLFKRILPGRVVSYPLLVDCPVFTLQGGGGAIQLPIQKGDTALVLFADRDIDAWFQNGAEAAPATARVHDLSDGIALVGLNAENSDLSAYPANEARMSLAGARFALKGGKANVQNATSSLYQVLNDLILGLQGALCASPGSPLVDTTGKIATALVGLTALLYKD